MPDVFSGGVIVVDVVVVAVVVMVLAALDDDTSVGGGGGGSGDPPQGFGVAENALWVVGGAGWGAGCSGLWEVVAGVVHGCWYPTPSSS